MVDDNETPEKDALQTPVGHGGRVWSPQKSAPISFKDKLIMIFSPLNIVVASIVVAMIVMPFIVMSDSKESAAANEAINLAYEQEYGYVNVEVALDKGKAQVTLSQTGETKEVSASTYKGAIILYETDEQLKTKMQEADAGTYEVLKAVKSEDK